MEHSKWRPSPGTIFGLLALVVAVAGTAIAGPQATTSLLNKKERNQVRKIAKTQINKAAPRFLHSDRVVSGSIQNASGSVGKVLFSDPATGLQVRAGNQGYPRLFNTNPGTELVVDATGWGGTLNVRGVEYTIQPGNFVQVDFEASGFRYGHFMVVKRVSDGSTAPRLQLTCAFRDAPIPAQNVLSCVGVR